MAIRNNRKYFYSKHTHLRSGNMIFWDYSQDDIDDKVCLEELNNELNSRDKQPDDNGLINELGDN